MKTLADYTMKEIAEMCDKQKDCLGCPLYLNSPYIKICMLQFGKPKCMLHDEYIHNRKFQLKEKEDGR